MINMEFTAVFDPEVSNRLPGLSMCIGALANVHVEKNNEQVKSLRNTVYEEVKARYKIETLRDDPTVRAYRDLHWKLGIDPTRTRPSGEALLRRFLNGNDLPDISNVVDAYNLASMKTVIPISGFDRDRLNLPLHVRFAGNGDVFTGIGMDKPLSLTERMLIVVDGKQVVCIYRYRDSDDTKITLNTRNVIVVGYGAPGIAECQLKEAVETTLGTSNKFLAERFRLWTFLRVVLRRHFVLSKAAAGVVQEGQCK
jgi:DNA/RNA-binding domain of Phe-tRNA-synthetase-like protein